MFLFAQSYCSEAGQAPQWGDNDSGRALPWTDRPSLQHGYLPSLGAALLGAPELKRAGEPLCDEALWLLGRAGLERFEQLEPLAEPRSFSSRAGGIHVLRGTDALVAVSAGRLGQAGQGGHNHNDQLAFELHVRGQPVVVDPGSPTYARDPGVRNAYRSTAAHSTLELDGEEHVVLDERALFRLADACRTELVAADFSAAADRLVAQHCAYESLPGAPVCRRTFLLDKDRRVLTVDDEVRGWGGHAVALPLHFAAADVRLRSLAPWELKRLGAAEAEGLEGLGRGVAYERSGRAIAVAIFAPDASIELAPYDYSPGYGETVRACMARVRWTVELPWRCRWWVLF
jgi:hypothetical protein